MNIDENNHNKWVGNQIQQQKIQPPFMIKTFKKLEIETSPTR